MTSKTPHALRCRCGTLQGLVEPSAAAARAVCYCRDCQAYARFLAQPGIVDAEGGTEVVAMHPRHLRFTTGLESLACLSLSPRGLLRWYASCCSTPLGNTPRDRKLAYVGLVHSCLRAPGSSLQASFGAVRITVNTPSAHGPALTTPLLGRVAAGVGLVSSLVGARLSGSYRDNPFFDAGSGEPLRRPRVITREERERAYAVL